MANIDEKFYVSVNGYKIKVFPDAPIISIDKDIVDSKLSDPITLQLMKRPMIVPYSGNVYDYDTIKKWFYSSNIEPLTGAKLTEKEIEFIPIMNYFLLLLCLEEPKLEGLEQKINEKEQYIFHCPYGDILNILHLAKNIFFSEQSVDKIISLNLNDYPVAAWHNVIDDDNGIKHPGFNFYWIELDQIICKCPFTKRSLNTKCCLTENGVLCCRQMYDCAKDKSDGTRSNWGTLTSFISSVSKEDFYLFDRNHISDVFDKNVNNNKIEKIICEFDNDKSKIDYSLVGDLEEINFTKIAYNNNFIFETQNEHSSKNTIPIRSHEMVIHDHYTKNTNTILNTYWNKLQDYIDTQQDKIFRFEPSFKNKLLNIREKYDIISFCDYNNCYGDDISCLTLKNSYDNVSLKDYYFVGTHFDNAVFTNSKFLECKFVAITGKITFVNCSFMYDTTFYKSNAEIIYINCQKDN